MSTTLPKLFILQGCAQLLFPEVLACPPAHHSHNAVITCNRCASAVYKYDKSIHSDHPTCNCTDVELDFVWAAPICIEKLRKKSVTALCKLFKLVHNKGTGMLLKVFCKHRLHLKEVYRLLILLWSFYCTTIREWGANAACNTPVLPSPPTKSLESGVFQHIIPYFVAWAG